MSDRLLLKSFEDFQGLDLYASALTRASNRAEVLKNFQRGERASIEGRKGHKTQARAGCRYGLARYLYVDSTTGEEEEELIGIDDLAYRLKEGTLVIDGPANSTFSFLVNATTETWKADCQVSGVSIAGFPLDCGTGQENSPVTLATLLAAINAVAGWSAVLTPHAVVDGNQTATRSNITVLAGHTVTASTSQMTRMKVETTVGDVWLDINAVGATTVGVFIVGAVGIAPTTVHTVSDGAFIGVGNEPATCLPLTSSTACASALTLTFEYWEEIFETTRASSRFGVVDGLTFGGLPSHHNYVMRNNSDCLYIGLPFSLGIPTYPLQTPDKRKTGLYKYDGLTLSAAGLPQTKIALITSTNALGGALSGTYKYLIRFKHVDNQGNVTYGNESLILGESTVTPPWPASFCLNVPTLYSCLEGDVGICFEGARSAAANGAQAIGATIGNKSVTVESGHNLRIGDWICYNDQADRTIGNVVNTIKRYRVTGVTDTTITFNKTDTGAHSISDGAHISSGTTVEIWRTKSEGQTYYFVDEMPAPYNEALKRGYFYDHRADADLGGEWLGPYTGRSRHDLPPVMPIIENHQGLLIGGGFKEESETISWSNENGPEGFPLGTNSLDVPASRPGRLTAIVSDNLDTLVAFKENCAVPIAGDFYSGAISIQNSQEGDVGCPSPHGWARIRNSIFFISNKGPRIFEGGQVTNFDKSLTNYFMNNYYRQAYNTAIASTNYTKLVVRRTVAIHDIDNQRVLFFVPAEGVAGQTVSCPNENSRIFVMDYGNALWSTFEFPALQNMAGGGDVYKNELYFSSVFVPSGGSVITSSLFKRLNTRTLYDYADNTKAINQVFKPQWEHLGEPSIDKQFKQVKVWSLNPDVFLAFTLTIKSYLNFSSLLDMNTTRAFSVATDLDAVVEMPLTRAKAMQLEFSCNTHFQRAHITGYELSAAVPYRKERVDDDKR